MGHASQWCFKYCIEMKCLLLIFGYLLGREAVLGQVAGSAFGSIAFEGPSVVSLGQADPNGALHEELSHQLHPLVPADPAAPLLPQSPPGHDSHVIGEPGMILGPAGGANDHGSHGQGVPIGGQPDIFGEPLGPAFGHSEFDGHGGHATGQAGNFGEPVGIAFVHSDDKRSHIDPPGVHGNILDIPVEHVQVGGAGNPHAPLIDKTPETIVDKAVIGGKQKTTLSGRDYMSRLAAGYDRLRRRRPPTSGVKEDLDTHTGKGGIIGTPFINPKPLTSHIDPPGTHGNFLDVPIEHLDTDQTDIHPADPHILGPAVPTDKQIAKKPVTMTGKDYMSRLTAGYIGRQRNKPTVKVSAPNDAGITAIGPGSSFGEPLGSATMHAADKSSHIDPPGVHGNFLDIPVEHVETGLHTDLPNQPPHDIDIHHGGVDIDLMIDPHGPDHIETTIPVGHEATAGIDSLHGHNPTDSVGGIGVGGVASIGILPRRLGRGRFGHRGRGRGPIGRGQRYNRRMANRIIRQTRPKRYDASNFDRRGRGMLRAIFG